MPIQFIHLCGREKIVRVFIAICSLFVVYSSSHREFAVQIYIYFHNECRTLFHCTTVRSKHMQSMCIHFRLLFTIVAVKRTIPTWVSPSSVVCCIERLRMPWHTCINTFLISCIAKNNYRCMCAQTLNSVLSRDTGNIGAGERCNASPHLCRRLFEHYVCVDFIVSRT